MTSTNKKSVQFVGCTQQLHAFCLRTKSKNYSTGTYTDSELRFLSAERTKRKR